MERYRKCVYCETRFLRRYISKLDKPQKDTLSHEHEMWESIKSLIFSSDIKLCLDISKATFDGYMQKIDQKRQKASERKHRVRLTAFERLLLDLNYKQAVNEVHLKFIEDFPQIKRFKVDKQLDLLNAFYFTCEDKKTCEMISKQYGIIVLSPDNISELSPVLLDQGVALRKREISNWQKILHKTYFPCNSAIIVDNYVLNETEQMIENLKGIFDAILPCSLNPGAPFHISIFTALKRDKRTDLPSQIRLKKITEMIHEIRPELNFKLSILKCSSDQFHDRTIITNNAYIGCGAGFNLFNKGKSQKTTTINIVFPFLNQNIKWASGAYSNLISDLLSVYNNVTEFQRDCIPNFFIGVKVNRILDSIKYVTKESRIIPQSILSSIRAT